MENTFKNNKSDMLVMATGLLVYVLLEWWIADSRTLGEGDLYRMLLGILNGAQSGAGILDPMHYGASFSFGYLWFIYAFAGDFALRHPPELIVFINQIGFWSAIGTLAFLWYAFRIAYSSVVACAAALLFGFSPLFITLGSSGHPVLPAYMFMALGASLFFLEKDWRFSFAACVFILLGLTMRADILLALPWVALTHKHANSWREFIHKSARRSMLLVGVFLAFLLIRHSELGAIPPKAGPAHPQTLKDYLDQFFLAKNVIGGGLSGALACGLATLIAFAAFAFMLFRRRGLIMPASGMLLAGPFTIIVISAAFWMPIGINSRHFITLLLGASLVIPLVMAEQLHWSRKRVFAVVITLIAANQLLSEAARPVLLRGYHSAYTDIPDEKRTLTMAPAGFSWEHVMTLQRRHRLYDAWITNTAEAVCDAKVVVMMDYDDEEQGISDLYGDKPVPQASLLESGDFKRVISVQKGERTFIFVSKADVWPADPLAAVLARPDLADAKILADPYSASFYDKMPIPETRAAHLGCKPPS